MLLWILLRLAVFYSVSYLNFINVSFNWTLLLLKNEYDLVLFMEYCYIFYRKKIWKLYRKLGNWYCFQNVLRLTFSFKFYRLVFNVCSPKYYCNFLSNISPNKFYFSYFTLFQIQHLNFFLKNTFFQMTIFRFLKKFLFILKNQVFQKRKQNLNSFASLFSNLSSKEQNDLKLHSFAQEILTFMLSSDRIKMYLTVSSPIIPDS